MQRKSVCMCLLARENGHREIESRALANRLLSYLKLQHFTRNITEIDVGIILVHHELRGCEKQLSSRRPLLWTQIHPQIKTARIAIDDHIDHAAPRKWVEISRIPRLL